MTWFIQLVCKLSEIRYQVRDVTVAEKVVVTTKHNDDGQHIWESQAGGSFAVTRDTTGEQLGRGTKITLYLKEDQERFLSCRKMEQENEGDMDVAMYIATSDDKKSQAWTKFYPSKLVLKRIASYARSSADLLSSLITNGAPNGYSWEAYLFSSNDK